MIFEQVRFLVKKPYNHGDHISGKKYTLTFLLGIVMGMGYEAKISSAGRSLYVTKAPEGMLPEIAHAFNSFLAIGEDWELQEAIEKYRRTDPQNRKPRV